MSSKTKPAIWSYDTGQRIHCFDSCQLTITWMSNIKDVPMVLVLLSIARGVRTYAQSRDNQNFPDRWVTKFYGMGPRLRVVGAHELRY